MPLAYNAPTFTGPFYRVHEGKVERLLCVQHIALCDGTGRTACIFEGQQYSMSYAKKNWYKLKSTAERKLASAERLENGSTKKKKKGLRRKRL